jgi:hypothetical protein
VSVGGEEVRMLWVGVKFIYIYIYTDIDIYRHRDIYACMFVCCICEGNGDLPKKG